MRIAVLLKNKSQGDWKQVHKNKVSKITSNTRGVPNTEGVLQRYRNNEDILIGTLLGDASFQTYNDGRTWRLRYLQKSEEYTRHLYKIWEGFTGTGPKYIEDRQGNGRWYFNTKVYEGFTEMAHKFYKKNEKGA